MPNLNQVPTEYDEWLRQLRRARNGGFHDAGYVIDCDYMGAWAWVFRPDRQAFQGSACAFANDWSGDKGITPGLAEAFSRWQDRFETANLSDIPRGSDGIEGFSWRQFHADGLRLAKQLKHELGPEYVVIYSRPFEDQTGRGPANMLITNDGRAAPYKHHAKTVLAQHPSQEN